MSAPPSPAPPRIAVVFHPHKGNVGRLRDAVTRAVQAAEMPEPLWLGTTPEKPGAAQTREAVAAGAGLVIASGGDGTVRQVASGLRGTHVPLGIVPMGTGNLLARNLALPLNDVQRAVEIALTGVDRPIDLGIAELARLNGSIDTGVFLVMAGLGADAAMIENTNPGLKQHVGWIAYIDGALRALPTLKPFRIRYAVHGHPEHSAHVSTILAGNCGLLPGFMELMPDASVDDGRLDVAILQPRSVWGWLAVWRKVTWENRVLRKSALGRTLIRFTGSDATGVVTYLRGRGVHISTDGERPVELDGDGMGAAVRAHLWADPGALTVRVATQASATP